MQRTSLIIVALLFSCSASYSQTMNTQALGATSALGIPGSSGSGTSSTGIPLGATEIDPGGMSTAIGTTCSTFDGGGLTTPAPMAAASDCTSSPNLSSRGTASPLSTPGSSTSSALNGSTIPLSSTELSNAGVSPIITIQAPSTESNTIGSTAMGVPSSSSGAPCSGPSSGSSFNSASGSTSTAGSLPGCY